MASFMDNEAVESDDDDISDDEERARAKKTKRPKALSSDEDEDEDEDEDRVREEMRGFIADDDEDDSDSGSGSDSDNQGRGSSARKRRRSRSNSRSRSRSRSENEDIDEEDMELIEENLGIRLKKARKRIRMGSDEDSGDEDRRERDDLPDIDQDRDRSLDEDDMEDDDNFIVDEHGRPLKKDRKKKKHHVFSDSALQLADDIFTVAVDYDLDDDEEEEDYDSEDETDEDEDGERQPRRKAKKKRATKTIFDEYEPDELARRHYTDRDNEIRNTDIPERMQLREPPVTPVAEHSNEIQEEGAWILKHYFLKPTLSLQVGYTPDVIRERERQPLLLEKIRNTVEYIRQGDEPPFIAFYRKEYVTPELDINDLWKIFSADGLWCKLQHQKRKLSELYDKMRLFQSEKIMNEPDKPLPDDLRIVSSDDIERVQNVETFEELKDLEQHFKLYYGKDTQAMQEWSRKKRKEDRENNLMAKKYRKKGTKTIVNDEGDEIEVTDEDAEEEELQDADLDDENHNTSIKQARKNDQYSLCLKNGLGGIEKRFGLSAEHFGENFLDGYTKHDVEQDPFDPLEVAADYVDQRRFNNPDMVLSAAKFMVATQLSKDPTVIKVCRTAMHQRGFITIKPTKLGLKVIDESHDCYTLKYIKDKPINTLKDDQWLRLVQAEQQKLIEIELAKKILGIKGRQSLVEEAAEYFSIDGYSKAITGWNKLRKECVEVALENMLLPSLRKELRLKLEREAKEGVLNACKAQLHDWLKVGKYEVEFEDEDEDDWGTADGVRVMGVMYEPDINVAAYAVTISPDGEMESFLKLENLLKRLNSYNPKDKQEKAQDLDKIKKFILSNKPHCIVVGISDRTGLDIKRDLENVIMELVNGDAQFPRIGVFAADDNLAKLYSNSSRADQDFRDFPNVFRQAVSLARRMQDPLLEFSQLCGTENEITCLRYHPYQDFLSQEELLEGLTLELVNRTCEVGIDINKCVAHNHMSHLVQFVGGLGPRKGAALLKTLRQMQSSQRLENRQQLVTLCHMGPKVLINCAGFIKIDTLRLGDSEVYVEVLDGSRIHNEAYEWARKMAVDALEYDEEEGNPANALDEILQEPEKLAELDLDAFAEELERQGFGKKHITLQDIRRELHHMYKDLRDPYRPPDMEELFNMVTKETPKTFYIGKIVQAKITNFVFKPPKNEELDKAAPQRKGETNLWQCPFCGSDDFPELTEVWNHFDAGTCPGKAIGIRIRLDNGVTGFIAMKNLSDSQIINPSERVKIGQIISCRIMKLNIERFTVDCLSKSSALQDKNNEWRPPRDDFYDFEAEAKDIEAEENTTKQQKRHAYMKRVIHHPNFYNISFKDAEKKLESMDLGDAIFRPSSKGENHLTVTWKIADGIYHHVDIKEEKKANAFSLGQSLIIGNEEYEALDEIIARFINPMAQHAKEIMDFKNYKDTNGGKRAVANDLIIQEKKAQPNKIHYFFSASQEFPGKFMLTYIPRETPKHEYVTVTPEGFKFRQQNFETLSQLMRWFKEHFRDKIPGGTPVTPGRLTGRTPYLNATPGGITPGAMSMAAGTPYGATPLSIYGAVNTPYTPSGQTPMLTPYATPGRHAHSATPKGYTGSTTPRYNPRPSHGSSRRGENSRGYKDSTPLYDE